MSPKLWGGLSVAALVAFAVAGPQFGTSKLNVGSDVFDFAHLTNTLLVFMLLAIIIEIACEVLVAALTTIGVLPPDLKTTLQRASNTTPAPIPDSNLDGNAAAAGVPVTDASIDSNAATNVTDGETADLEVNKQRQSLAQLLCIGFGLIASTAGFLFLDLSMQALKVTGFSLEQSNWRNLDMVVTALILAGGADSFHRIMDKFRTAAGKPTITSPPKGNAS